jgi:hypothetical protein
VTAAPDHVAAAVAALRRKCGMPTTHDRRGPVLLDRFFEETNLAHVALPGLTRSAVAGQLRADGVPVEDLGDASERLAGFVFLAGRVGWVLHGSNAVAALKQEATWQRCLDWTSSPRLKRRGRIGV